MHPQEKDWQIGVVTREQDMKKEKQVMIHKVL